MRGGRDLQRTQNFGRNRLDGGVDLGLGHAHRRHGEIDPVELLRIFGKRHVAARPDIIDDGANDRVHVFGNFALGRQEGGKPLLEAFRCLIQPDCQCRYSSLHTQTNQISSAGMTRLWMRFPTRRRYPQAEPRCTRHPAQWLPCPMSASSTVPSGPSPFCSKRMASSDKTSSPFLRSMPVERTASTRLKTTAARRRSKPLRFLPASSHTKRLTAIEN